MATSGIFEDSAGSGCPPRGGGERSGHFCRLDILIAEYLDGVISQPDLDELAAAINRDEGKREQFARAVEFDLVIKQYFAGARPAASLSAEQERSPSGRLLREATGHALGQDDPRRSSRRIDVQAPFIKLYLRSQTRDLRNAEVRNISGSGLSFHCSEGIAKGAHVGIMLNFPREEANFSREAEVVWAKQVSEEHWEVGCRFFGGPGNPLRG